MPPFPKPAFAYDYHVDTELTALRAYRDTQPGRSIPRANIPGRLLVATWNVANLGVQERREDDYRLIAEVIGWFDVIALQEVNDNLEGLRGIQRFLPASYQVLFSDKSGNNERHAFVWASSRVSLLDKVGEVAIPPSEISHIKLPRIQQKFDAFDRNPHLAAFRADDFTFILANVHLFFGSDSSKRDMNRRCLETYAVARWADLRRKSRFAYTANVIPLGDFNLPKVGPDDPVFQALTSRGLHLPKHSTEMGSSIRTDRHYDQIAFFPGPTADAFVQSGVFDFDGALFADLWNVRTADEYFAYVRYYISDHRPLWAEFRTI